MARSGKRSSATATLAQGVLSPAGRAGPRRLVALLFAAGVVVAVVAAVLSTGQEQVPVSRDARQPRVDPLPGGLNTTPAQDAVARLSQEQGASQALNQGVSYTPPIAPARRMVDGVPVSDPPEPGTRPQQPPRDVVQRPLQAAPATPPAVPMPAVVPAAWLRPVATPLEVERVQMVTPPRAPEPPVPEHIRREIGDLFSQWSTRAPRTELVLPPERRAEADVPDGARAAPVAERPRPAAVTQSLPGEVAARAGEGEILIPAGRGIFARAILSVNSDQSSPVVLEAMSGPIAGDRLIGSFQTEGDRLVIRVTSLARGLETIAVDGVVIASGTMEAGVASSVDQQYLRRFLLPASAAFVRGLGQAIQQGSRSSGVISPFGSVTVQQDLNLEQQLAIGAATAAGRIGAELDRSAPRGPTVRLDAGSTVGVVFLTPVVSRGRN